LTAPHPNEGDKVLFILDGGQLTPEHVAQIQLDPAEIAEYGFHDPELISQLLISRLAYRIKAAISVLPTSSTVYLEYGKDNERRKH
jgi:8-oxo-dGTP diphosphatase